MANIFTPQNVAFKSLQISVDYFSSFENLALKRPREVITLLVFNFFLRADSGILKSSAIDLLLSAISRRQLTFSRLGS